tara:strand:+ start:260 stop:868 length:609 start_codon:yes stop_codon:yes gene_type:complete
MGRFTDVMRKEEEIEDSLKLAEAKHDSTIQALEQIKIVKDKRDSLTTELAKAESIPDMDILEKAEQVPLVKLTKLIVGEGLHTAEAFNQAVYDLGVLAINAQGVPFNYLSKMITGYNPGISGERYMNYLMGVGEGSLYEGWAGLGEGKRYPGPGRFFGKDDPNEASMLGGLISGDAPEGGEWLWETEARKKADVIKEELEKE